MITLYRVILFRAATYLLDLLDTYAASTETDIDDIMVQQVRDLFEDLGLLVPVGEPQPVSPSA